MRSRFPQVGWLSIFSRFNEGERYCARSTVLGFAGKYCENESEGMKVDPLVADGTRLATRLLQSHPLVQEGDGGEVLPGSRCVFTTHRNSDQSGQLENLQV